jgi:PmbA protein
MTEVAAQSEMTVLDLESLAADVVALAMKAGASDAEAAVREGDEFSVNVRLGQVETLKDSGSRGLGLRVFLGKRSASASTSDLTAEGIRQLVDGALDLAKITEEDPCSGLAESGEFGSVPGDLRLYDEDVYSLPGAERIEWARRAEAAALAADPRITNSDGGSFQAATGRKALANSRGFVGGYRSSYAGVAVSPMAEDVDGSKQVDYWWSGARRTTDLESPESIGKEAARRTLRRLGARRVPTQRVPIVFAPEVAGSLLGSIFEAASGDVIWRGASFLAGRLGEQIASRQFNPGGRQHHAAAHRHGRLRNFPIRRRRPALAAHRGGGAGRAAQLPAEHLHCAQAGHEVHA